MTGGGLREGVGLLIANDPDFDAEALLRYAHSLDLSGLRQFRNVQTAPLRNHLAYRWQRHWDNRETIHDDVLYRPGLWQPFGRDGQAPVWSFAPYFESFNDSLKPEVYAGYFQTADVKPWGRYFLREWAFALAELDAHEMLLGGQPIGTLGRETVVREFARAYRALPSEPFETVGGDSGPVTVRSLQTENGTYVYFVNTSWSDVSVDASFSVETAVEDLGEGTALPGGSALSVDLKPYQLRAFLLAERNIAVESIAVNLIE